MRRWTETDIRKAHARIKVRASHGGVPKKKRPKYGNTKVRYDGILFDSKLELSRYKELVLLQAAGAVRFFCRQAIFDLGGGVQYKADFVVFYSDSNSLAVTGDRATVEDTTGMLTQVKINKLKQVKARYGVDVLLLDANERMPPVRTPRASRTSRRARRG